MSGTVLAFGLLIANAALACSCAGPIPVCSVYWTTPTVFLGHVVRIDHTYDKPPTEIIGPGKNLVHFEVTATYRGTPAKELIIKTNDQSSACGYAFQQGHDYLVFASTFQGELTASQCTRTHEVIDAADDADIRCIAGLTSLAPGASIYGFIRSTAVAESGAYKVTQLAGIPVSLNGPQARKIYSDAEGKFRADGLPPGKYTVSAEAPEHYAPFMKSTVTIQDRGCAEIPMGTRLDGHIRGHLFFSDGAPAAGVNLTMKRADTSPNKAWTAGAAYTTSASDGAFDFSQLSPGTYIYGANLDFTSPNGFPYYRKAFFPGTVNRSEAAVVTITAGQIVEDQRFFLPPDSGKPAVPLHVTVRESDGQLVANAQVIAADSIWENSVTPLTESANESGVATLTLRPATHYDVSAYVNRPDRTQACAESIGVDVKEDRLAPVVLVLSHHFGNCRQFKKP